MAPIYRSSMAVSAAELKSRGTPVIEGPIARESNVAENMVNRRWAQLYHGFKTEPPVLVSYRRREDAEPSKVWNITRQCTLTQPVERAMKLRVNHSTLVAHVAGLSTPCQMTCFTLRFNSGKLWGPDRLTLCFESAEIAFAWHQKLSEEIISNASKRVIVVPHSSPTPSSHDGQPGSVRTVQESPSIRLMDEVAQMVEVNSAGDDYQAYQPRSWRSLFHTNGVTVYEEEEGDDGEGGAFMVSCVVRATPKDTFKGIMQLPFSNDARMMFGDAQILEVIDPRAQVLHHMWQPSGSWGRWWATRDMVLLRTWRQEVDGSYIVLYQSTQNDLKVPNHSQRQGSTSGWSSPVRSKIQAAGYTVAPLLPEYTMNGESHECLVTLVVKVDLGGWLSQQGILGQLVGGWKRPWLDPMILSVVALRDKVEQRRFMLGASSLGAGVNAPTPRNSCDIEPKFSHRRLSMTLPTYSQQQAQQAADGSCGGAVAESGPCNGIPVSTVPQPSEQEEWAVGGTCHPCWTCPGASGIKIRGKRYLQDRKKIPSALPMFDLHSADLLDVDEPVWNIARFLPSVKYCQEPFMFIMQLMIPCSPPQSLTITWTAPVNPMTADMEELLEHYPEDELGTVRAFFTNFKSWLEGDGKEADKRRNTKFKLIPQIVKGSWIVKQSVGTTPVLLGQKLLTRYFRGPNYFEVDVDITANTVAASVTSLVVGAITSLVVDLCVLVEGQASEELPERLAGTVRFNHLRLKNAAYLDEETGKIYKGEQCA